MDLNQTSDQMEMFGYTAEGAQQEADKFVGEAGNLEEDISKAASSLVPFYDSGVNIVNVAQEYMKPEQERDYDYIKSQFTEAGQSAAIEGGLLLMGGVAGKYGAKGIKALADKVKQYEIDPTAMSAFGVGAIRKKPTIDRAADVSEAERLIDDPDALKAWQETEGGKGKRQENPTDSEAAAEALYRGDITSKEARKRVGEAIPPPKEYTADEVRKMMPTVTDVTGAMGKKARDYGILGVKGFDLKEGQLLGTRLDIPAYNKYDKWVVSIHDGGTKEKINLKGSVLGYGQAIRLKNVRFGSQSKEALDIARGKILVKKTGKEKPFGKSTIARAVGEYVPEDPYKLQEMAASIIESGSKEWTQVGMNPYRGSQFYDKKTGKIIFDADEMIQVGPLVLAKNAKVATISDLKEMAVRTKDGKLRMFNEGGAAMKDQMQMAFMDEGGIADDGMDVDPVSGNEVPPGSLAEEVRDDIPAQLSEGEYVVPADVVRYYGVKFFEDLRDQAKMGLADMEANGRIGGEPVPAGGPVNDEELSEQEMSAIRQMMTGMAEGGEVQNPYLQQQQLYSQPRPAPIDEKRNTTITGINPVEGQMPMQSMASGGQVQGYQDSGDVMKDAPSFVQNQFNPAQYGLGYSFMGQPQQTGTNGTTTSQAPQGQTLVTLYHPEYATNGRSKTFYLPRDSAVYQEYLGRGYTKQMPMTGSAEAPTTTDTPVTTDLTGAKVTTGSGPEGSNTGTSSINASIEDKDLDKTTKGFSLLADLSTALAGQLGVPLATLINTKAVAKYNDALKDQSKRKGSIFGGEGSLYDELTDVNKDKKKNFGDTWLGDLLGFDKKAGVQGPNLKDSFMGARRGFDTAQLESNAPISSTANNLVEPENRLKNQRGFTPKSTAPKTQAQKDSAAKNSINDWVSATNATKGKKGIERQKAIKAQSDASRKATKAIREASGYNKKNEGGLMNKKGKK